MKAMELLRKLGILRFGAEKAVYRNAAERPLSLQQDGVFDSEKDVIRPRAPRPAGQAGAPEAGQTETR